MIEQLIESNMIDTDALKSPDTCFFSPYTDVPSANILEDVMKQVGVCGRFFLLVLMCACLDTG